MSAPVSGVPVLSVSVLTLVRGRRTHLVNLMRSLACQTKAPDELVIAWMQDTAHDELPDPGCPVRHVFVPGEELPLAKARNLAAQGASGDLLIFLDVDCVPSPRTVEAYALASVREDGLFLGEVYYLPAEAITQEGAGEALDFDALDRLGRVHPSKPAVPQTGVRREKNAGELWGLSFALHRDRYLSIGGMDEAFVGYGGEETDFAVRLSASGLPFFWTAGARSYHQHHAVLVPPLHNFEPILRNATLFHRRHGRWCMDYWLGQFRDAGLIDWHPEAEHITLRRPPSPAEIEAARRPDLLFS